MSEKVLLIDDEKDFLEVMSERMQNRDIDVTTASSAREALALVEKESYDAIILDLQMPEMDGYQATAAIRARERALGRPRLPIFALTANALKEDEARSRAAGCDKHLSKPINARALQAALAEVADGLRD